MMISYFGLEIIMQKCSYRFPDWVIDAEQVAEYYRPLKFKLGNYFENAIQAQIFTELMPSIKHCRNHDIERGELFKDHLWQLNAVHLVNLVQIQINPGFLQRPLFSELNPSAMNYGSLGGVIGHEVHSFIIDLVFCRLNNMNMLYK